MTREKALEALRVYCGWKYDTSIELWPTYSRDEYLRIAMDGLNTLDEELIIKLGMDSLKQMENPVGMLLNQLREMQNA